MTEIPFWFHDRPKWVSGIGRATTCADVLHSLVRSHADRSARQTKLTDADARATAAQLALVEQWRGVERPLSNQSKILKLWQAWGEERGQVKFVVKRLSTTTASQNAPAAASAGPTGPTARKPRRRNSRLASTRAADMWTTKKAGDTVHPNKASPSSSPSGKTGAEIERLMRTILTQGETIHNQLKKLQEREGQIDCIEQKVHDTRTKTAGKDYLLDAYLDLGRSKKAATVIKPGDKEQPVPECLQEMVDALSQVHKLNEQLEDTEERLSDLQCQLSLGAKSRSVGDLRGDMEATRSEVGKLRTMNDRVGEEIDYNRGLISNLQSAFDERKELMSRLEQDCTTAESEGRMLEVELRRVTERVPLVPSPILGSGFHGTNITDEELDEELLNDLLDPEAKYRLSNSQLYEDVTAASSGQPGKQLASIAEEKLYSQLQRLHIKTQQDPLDRTHVTGSPGSSSGNSSGSGISSVSEKSVRFSDRDLIMSTPELPPIGDFPPDTTKVPTSVKVSAKAMSQYTKSILKAVDPAGDLDSNSDTGLSSLHSSSDEGTYVLDTLV